jgi:hypothetical protein
MNGQGWDAARYSLEVLKVTAKIDSIPPGELSPETLLTLIDHFPPQYTTTTYDLFQSGFRAHELSKYAQTLENERKIKQMGQDQSREVRYFWAGLFLLVFAFFGSAFIPTLRPMTELVLRVMAGAGVCCLIAFLPGLFSIDSEINVKRNKLIIRATGGLAGLVMVYFFDPGWISAIFHATK